MNRLAGSALYGTIGGAMMFGVYELMPPNTGVNGDEAEQRANIEACAAILPVKPAHEPEVPEPCTKFEFDNTETVQKITVDGIMNETVTVEFNLPSRIDFSVYANEDVTTDAQRGADNRRMRNILVSGIVAIGALTGLAIPPRTFPPKNNRG